MSEGLTWQRRCNSTVWTLDLQNILSHVSLNREFPGPEDRCTNRTDGDWQLKECRGSSKAYRDLSFLGYAYNLLQQKSSWGKERISQKLSEASREDGFLDRVVNKRNCLRLFVIISWRELLPLLTGLPAYWFHTSRALDICIADWLLRAEFRGLIQHPKCVQVLVSRGEMAEN